jgi:hypothetical protein
VRASVLLSLLVLCAGVVPGEAEAQQRKNNALVVDVFGPAVLGSINYERRISGGLMARAGVGGIPAGLDAGATLNAPLMVSYVAGQGVHRAEVGAGVVLVYDLPYRGDSPEGLYAQRGFDRPELTGALAYRWHPHGNDGYYRLGFTPVLRDRGIAPLFGLSVGVGF